jgi:hypothetical protein
MEDSQWWLMEPNTTCHENQSNDQSMDCFFFFVNSDFSSHSRVRKIDIEIEIEMETCFSSEGLSRVSRSISVPSSDPCIIFPDFTALIIDSLFTNLYFFFRKILCKSFPKEFID